MDENLIDQILAEFEESQQAFLELLAQTDEASLYHKGDAADWSAAMVLVHIAEAREFFAGEIEKILAEPPETVGRTLDDPHRLQTIASYGQASVEEIRRRLVRSHQIMAGTVRKVTATHLKLQPVHVSYGPLTMTEFLQRFVVGHDRAHVQQVKTLLEGE